jgi:hypothetical protein
VGDRGRSSPTSRRHARGAGARPAIPPRGNGAAVARPGWIHDNRDRVERRRARLEEGRAVATRYQKTAVRFAGALGLAAAPTGSSDDTP